MPALGTILCYLLVGLVLAGAARLYLRDARDRRAGLGDDTFAWRRGSGGQQLNRLTTAPPKPLLRTLPQRWGRRQKVIAGAQATVIVSGLGLLLGISYFGAAQVSLLAYPIAFFILFFAVAFVTFLLTWA